MKKYTIFKCWQFDEIFYTASSLQTLEYLALFSDLFRDNKYIFSRNSWTLMMMITPTLVPIRGVGGQEAGGEVWAIRAEEEGNVDK